MGAFRKRTDLHYRVPQSPPTMIQVMETKQVCEEGSDVPTTIVSMVTRPLSEYAGDLLLPSDSDYKLGDMIASGNIPQEVPVSGMLDSSDPLDLSNAGVGDAILGKLTSIVDSQKTQPTPEPTPSSSVQPSNE